MMKRIIFSLTLIVFMLPAIAQQRVSHDFKHLSLRQVLTILNEESQDYRIHCLFNELEQQTITISINNLTIPEAIKEITKGQPVKTKTKGRDIFVQYQKKEEKPMMELHGLILDYQTHSQLIDASVQLLTKDSSIVAQTKAHMTYNTYISSRDRAEFYLKFPKQEGQYILKISHIGYHTTYINYTLAHLKKGEFMRDIPTVYLKQKRNVLKEVNVIASKVTFYHRGDTLVFNADAFQLAEGSMLDELVKQLPGVELKSSGQIFYNGKFVENLLLNGKDFFRGHQEVLLENLPNYTVKEIKIYDKYGQKSTFLGEKFEDDKTFVMDVRLKKEYSIGKLGNAEAGIGSEDRYLARLFALCFNNHSRVSVFGNSNNLNDNSKPSENGSAAPGQEKPGLQAIRRAGLSYNTEGNHGKWFADGQVQISHIDTDNQQATETINFLSNGNTFERISNNMRNKNYGFSTAHQLSAEFKHFNLWLSPVLTYSRYDRQSSLSSALSSEGDTLINSQSRTSQMKGHRLNAQVEGMSNIKIDGANKYLTLMFTGNMTTQDEDRFSHFTVDYGNDIPSIYNDQYVKNHPNRSHSFTNQLSYNQRLSATLRLALIYDFQHEGRQWKSTRFLFDALDTQNSFDHREHSNKHIFMTLIHWNKKFNKHNFNMQIYIPGISYHRRQLHYQRGNMDTTIIRNSAYIHRLQTEIKLKKQDAHTFMFDYRLTAQTPQLTDLVDIRDATDPMNIYVGSPSLRNEAIHHFYFNGGDFTTSQKKTSHGFWIEAELHQNHLVKGYDYDRQTGIRTFQSYNVNGDWSFNGHYDIRTSLDKRKRVKLSSEAAVYYHHLVNIINKRTVIHDWLPTEKLQLTWQTRENRYTLLVEETPRWTRGQQEAGSFFMNQIKYGGTALVHLPWKVELSTSCFAYTRSGCTDKKMNGSDIIWDIRLSRPLLKNKLILMLNACDLLGERTNLVRSVSANYKMETISNTLPNFVLLHAIYRFNQTPKKRN